MISEILGYFGGILIVASMVPQVIKNWKEQSAKDISFLRSIIYVLGVVIFIAYGFLIKETPIILMNFIGLFLGLTSLLQKIAYGANH